MTDKRNAGWQRWVLVGVLALAFGLRLYRLGAESLWYDETVSAYLASKSLAGLVAHTAGDIHPPGYYVLLHAWTRLAGSSEFSLAFLSLVFGLLLVALAHRLAVWAFGARAGLLAALLVAISPFNLWYSQEVRMYTLGALLSVGALGAVIRLLIPLPGRARGGHAGLVLGERGRLGDGDWPLLAAYALCGALGLWTLYYFAFLLVAVNLMVGVWWLVGWRQGRVGWRWLGRWMLTQGAVLLLYALWMPVVWRQATQPPVPPWRSFTALSTVLSETWTALGLGQSVEPQKVWPVLFLFTILFCLGLLSQKLRPRLQGTLRGGALLPCFFAGYVFLPVLLIYLASFIMPLYHVRYTFTYSTPFYIVVGAGLAWLWGRWRSAAWLCLALIVAFSSLSIYRYHTDPQYASDDHREATRMLAERWRPGDAILVNAGYAYTALVTYWDGDPIAWRGRLVEPYGEAATEGPVVLQTGTVGGDSSLGWGDADSDFYAMSWAATEDALSRLFADYNRVWVYRIYDTVTDPEGAIRRWLDERGIQFEDGVFTGEGQLRVQGFLTGRDPLGEAEPIVDVGLADGSLRLLSASSRQSPVEVGGAIDLSLVWRVGSLPDDEVIFFAGLFDEAGQRWAQADERAYGPLYPAKDWPRGTIVRMPLRVPVPSGTPPGSYWLEVGVYRFVDGQPLWLPWTTGQRWVLGEVDIVPPADWQALPLPEVTYPIDVAVGSGVRLVGFDAPELEGRPGDSLQLDLVWQALEDAPEPGAIVLQLTDDAGHVVVEASSAPVGGRVPFAGLEAGQAVRDPHSLSLPGDLAPGVYNLSVARRGADGTWLPIRRSPFSLGSTYPLATIRVLGRDGDLTPPAVERPVEARFGETMRLVGYDLQERGDRLQLTLYWQALAPTATPHKVFAHLVGEGGPADIRAQADAWPHVPTTGWVSGEYLRDRVTLDLPADLPAGRYALLVGVYDEATGVRLTVLDAAGGSAGDSLLLEEIRPGE